MQVPAAGKRGFDTGEKFVGRKRRIAVDNDGRRLVVKRTTDDISDSAGAHKIVAALRNLRLWRKRLFADGAWDGTRIIDAVTYGDFVLEIVPGTSHEPRNKYLLISEKFL